MISYKDQEGVTKLYEIERQGPNFQFYETILSQDRRLTGLSYNVRDLHLWAFDVDSHELVRINSLGQIQIVGQVEETDFDLEYHSGMMSPSGRTYYFLGFDPVAQSDAKFFKIDLETAVLRAEFIDISRSTNSRIRDMAVDPIFGEIYGFNNARGTIIQMGVNGQLTSLSFPPLGEQKIDALFFNRDGEFYGYTTDGDLFKIGLHNGSMELIQKGPNGTHVDGCSCPYTSTFKKSIIPAKIIPCEPFHVRYEFVNYLGISQTAVQLRDTFPAGFEILDISGSVPYTLLQPAAPDHILALENVIYFVGFNFIDVTVLPASDYIGQFSSQAFQQPFPRALVPVHKSDDPTTEVLADPTVAEIVNEESAEFEDQISFNCGGNLAIIESPLEADSYLWSTGSTENSIEVATPGWYTLRLENDCFYFYDSIYVEQFPGQNFVFLGDDRSVDFRSSVLFTANLERSQADSIWWYQDGELIDCDMCPAISVSPELTALISVEVVDAEGCRMSDEAVVEINYEQSIYAPNIFSPNGDGINDEFFISSSLPGTVSMYVFNRWGNLVFSRRNVSLGSTGQGWDGKVNDGFAGLGTYIWIAELEFANGEREVITGDVVLITGSN